MYRQYAAIINWGVVLHGLYSYNNSRLHELCQTRERGLSPVQFGLAKFQPTLQPKLDHSRTAVALPGSQAGCSENDLCTAAFKLPKSGRGQTLLRIITNGKFKFPMVCFHLSLFDIF